MEKLKENGYDSLAWILAQWNINQFGLVLLLNWLEVQEINYNQKNGC